MYKRRDVEIFPYAIAGKGRILLLVALLAFLLIPAVLVKADTGYVADEAGLYTQEETEQLENSCEEFAGNYGFTAFILTVDNDTVGGESENDNIDYIEAYADENYPDGAIGLLVNKEFRYYYIDISGNTPLNIFTDARQEDIRSAVRSELSEDDWYGAASTFLDEVSSYAGYAEEYDDQESYQDYEGGESRATEGADVMGYVIPAAVIAAIVAVIFLSVQMSRHHEANMARDAAGYIKPGSVKMDVREDRFISQYVTQVRIHDQDSGGGPPGTHVHMSSGGHSHSGGGGHF